MRFRPLLLLLVPLMLLGGCSTTTSLTASDINMLQQSSAEGVLLVSTGRRERSLPYLPVVYYKVLSLNSAGKIQAVADLKSEVMDLRYFNGNHFSGTGKQSVVHVLRMPSGVYWLAGYERSKSAYLPLAKGGVLVPMASSANARILYRIEIFPGKLSYAGELITNSDSLASNASVTVFDEFERDIDFVVREHPHFKTLPSKKSLAVAQE